MRINPCFGCPLRNGCPDREVWRAKVAGTGFRSVTFNCPRLTAELRLGRNIEIAVPYVKERRGRYDEGIDYVFGDKLVRATIVSVSARGHKFSCVVEPGQIDEDELPDYIDSADKVRFRKARKHSTIKRFLLGPDAELGECCCHVIRDGVCDVPPGETCNHRGGIIGGPLPEGAELTTDAEIWTF